MARTTATKVKEIIETSLSDTIVDAYILGATNMVTDNLTGEGLTDDTLAEIERWLAAHLMASTRERMAKKEGGGPAPSIEYLGEAGSGLESTPYGQMALTLDSSGVLASLGVRTASIIAVKSFS